MPAKKRAGSGARAAFARAGLAKPEDKTSGVAGDMPKAPEGQAQASVAGDATALADEVQADNEPKSKYTLLLDGDEAATFDGLALVLRRRLGRVVKKSDVLRALIALASDDQTLTAQLETELRRRK